MLSLLCMSWNSSDSKVAGIGLDDWGSIPGRSSGLFLFIAFSRLVLGQWSLLSNGSKVFFPHVKLLEHEGSHSLAFSVT